MKPGAWVIVALLAVAALWGGKWYLLDSGKVFKKTEHEAQSINKLTLPTAPKNAEAVVLTYEAPSSKPVAKSGTPDITVATWAWNAQSGVLLANGGPVTTKGSLIDKQGLVVKFTRQDDCPTMRQWLVKFATDYKTGGAQVALQGQGVSSVVIMGDGGPNFLYALNQELGKLGPEYKAKVIASFGKSQGEDGFWVPAEVAKDPQKARGIVCACVELDGDWNIAALWAGMNNIPINTDDKIYDPDAINFVNTGSYTDAVQKVITGYKEKRAKVKNKIVVDANYEVTVNSCATWTPGDVTLTKEGKGGYVKVLSTKENESQMAATLIVIGKFAQDNKDKFAKFILAACQGADQVKTYPEALDQAANISADYYKEPAPTTGVVEASDDPSQGAYWKKYFIGASIADKTGNNVNCGGSKVDNLGDNLQYFGLATGSTDVYKTVYNLFGTLGVKLYPSMLPSYPPYSEIFDPQYLKAAQALVPADKQADIVAEADVPTYDNKPIEQKVSGRNWKVNFETGKSTISPESYPTLEELYAQLVASNRTKINLYGHTDNTGQDDVNVPLSKARAYAVFSYLNHKNPTVFPRSRFADIQGFGSEKPVADNNSASGRDQNRRVEIQTGN